MSLQARVRSSVQADLDLHTGDIFIINFPDEGERVSSEVVDRDRLRPLHRSQQPIQQSTFQQKQVVSNSNNSQQPRGGIGGET